jgi:hypothetical protein
MPNATQEPEVQGRYRQPEVPGSVRQDQASAIEYDVSVVGSREPTAAVAHWFQARGRRAFPTQTENGDLVA